MIVCLLTLLESMVGPLPSSIIDSLDCIRPSLASSLDPPLGFGVLLKKQKQRWSNNYFLNLNVPCFKYL